MTADRPPARRRLQIYAFDPMLATTRERVGPATVTVSIPYEDLKPGPAGTRVQVVDFDGGHVPQPCFYEPVDLNRTFLTLQDGLVPSEADPRFHQQMVYAVAMRVLEAVDKAIGRRLRPRRGRLRLFPHAFRGANAYYSRQVGGVLFGYFSAETAEVGLNLPGQTIYTCLSHDIVAHEVAHGLVDRLRPWFLYDTNPDVPAFHEAVADLVAIFLHFTLPDVVAATIAHTRTDLTDPTPLLELAQQFGYATGRGAALRSGLDLPDPRLYQREHEAHERGAILVAAVIDAFLSIYRARTADLIRLATGGSGRLPPGALPPDLVARVAREATVTAWQFLNVCLRTFDYLPPVDPTFSDFLRALVTADRALYPVDAGGLRLSLVDGFRRRGIYPEGVASLAEDVLAWEDASGLVDEPLPGVEDWLWATIKALNPQALLDPDDQADIDNAGPRPSDESPAQSQQWADRLAKFGLDNGAALGLDPEAPVLVQGFHPTLQFGEDGTPKVSFVVQYTQRVSPDSCPGLGEVVNDVRRGTTVVADVDGKISHVIAKPIGGVGTASAYASQAQSRLDRLVGYLDRRAWRDLSTAFTGGPSDRLELDFALLHRSPR